MRDATSEGRIFIGLGAALFGLCCAIGISATSTDQALIELASPRRWLLVASGVAVNLATLALMRLFVGIKAATVFLGFVLLVGASLMAGFRWLQLQVPVGFWLADIWIMTACYAVLTVRARRRAAMQPDVQSSFLASRLSK